MPAVFLLLRLVLLAVMLSSGNLCAAPGAARATLYLHATESNSYPQWQLLKTAHPVGLAPADDHVPGAGGSCWMTGNSAALLMAYFCLPYVVVGPAAPVTGAPGQVYRLRACVFPNAP